MLCGDPGHSAVIASVFTQAREGTTEILQVPIHCTNGLLELTRLDTKRNSNISCSRLPPKATLYRKPGHTYPPPTFMVSVQGVAVSPSLCSLGKSTHVAPSVVKDFDIGL